MRPHGFPSSCAWQRMKPEAAQIPVQNYYGGGQAPAILGIGIHCLRLAQSQHQGECEQSAEDCELCVVMARMATLHRAYDSLANADPPGR